MNISQACRLHLLIVLLLGPAIANKFTGNSLQAQDSEILKKTSAYNVVWDSPSANSLGSMPIGNGDIGMNVWVEENGDLYFYLSKTDAWSENGQLLKLGKVRISLVPNPFIKGRPFRQELRLVDGEIRITAGKPEAGVDISVRVDANHPAGEIRVVSKKPVQVTAELQPWRTARRVMSDKDELVSVYGLEAVDGGPVVQEPDVFLPATGNRVVWYHRNNRSVWKENLELQALAEYAEGAADPLFYRTFGASMEGSGMIPASPLALKTPGKVTQCSLTICALTAQTVTVDDWLNQMEYIRKNIRSISEDARLARHREWWSRFWTRSWIFVSSPDAFRNEQAATLTRGYILQRYINACGGRGGSPIKFNGSIFTVDTYNRKESGGYDADFRRWGGPYWFQNTRLPYWAMLGSGDVEMLKPLFSMYFDALPIRKFATRKYYGHGGAHFPETMNFWGTWTNVNYGFNRTGKPDGLTDNTYIRYYWTSGLELSLMMLDYYDFTRSGSFARDTLVPILTEMLEFFDKHWHKDIGGKILFTPAQSLETYQTAVNPAPDIAGLRHVLSRALNHKSLPIDAALRQRWESLQAAVPDLPLRVVRGDTVLAPAAFSAQEANVENPELYAVFPFRLYGVGKPDIGLAINTFVHRKFRSNIGWQHSAIQAASLGLAKEAFDLTLEKFSNPDPACRFPAFWGPNYDWTPDQDHGTVAMIALQRMLLQVDGDSVLTLPAWPEGFQVDFRLPAGGGEFKQMTK